MPESPEGALRAEVDRLRSALAQTEERFSSFLESEVETIFCYELPEPVDISLPPSKIAARFLEARLVMCNALYARIRGAERPEDLYGRTMPELARENLDRVRQLIETLILEGNRPDGLEIKQLQPDGSLRYALSKGHLVVNDGHARRLWVILKDITEQKQLRKEREALEAQLRQAQRMESLGLLAGGIAHDFNNLLVVIENCTQFAREDLDRNPLAARDALDQVLGASRRAAELTRSLMAFTRRTGGTFQPLNVDRLVGELVDLLRRLVPARISLQTSFHAPTVVAKVDRGQVEQMLVNLVINAIEAIDDVGTINLTTTEVELTPTQKVSCPWVPDTPFLRVSVVDTGRGIEPALRQRVFEPFFTTKPDGKGTGLGLSIVWGTAKRHGGFAEADVLEPEGKTRFSIYLPSCELDAASETDVVLPSAAKGENETVLLVEDHAMVRDVARDVLERGGYRVLVARDGAEALSLFEAHGDRIDAVILDAIIPQVNGYQVYQQLIAQRPTLPVIVASGYNEGVFPPGFFDAPRLISLAKPYRGDDLLAKLRTLLDAAPRQT